MSLGSFFRRAAGNDGAFSRIALYLLALLTPLTLVAVFRPRTDHSFTFELGKNFALVGLTVLALQFVLSARLKWIEAPFGLDVLTGFHRSMGIFAAVLLTAHPFLLALGDGDPSLLTAFDVEWYIWLARAALLMLLVHGIISSFRAALRMDYRRWLRWHNALAVAFFASGILHSWFAGGDLALPQMRILWVGLLAVAFGTYAYRRAIRPRRLLRSAYRVLDIVNESHNVWTIALAPSKGDALTYLPGQFYFLALHRAGRPGVEMHPFTISSSPTQAGYVSSTIKESGDFTRTIGRTKPGDLAVVHGAFGRFSYVLYPEETDLVFIAGGIGITPFMSMLRHMRDTEAHIRATLL